MMCEESWTKKGGVNEVLGENKLMNTFKKPVHFERKAELNKMNRHIMM